MLEALIISNLILWVLVIGLSLLLFALTRQVGVLHERVAPAGALMPTSGPKVGEGTAPLQLQSLQGEAVSVGGEQASGTATLLLFISPSCPVCKGLVPTARSLVASEAPRLRLLFASDGADTERELDSHRRYVSDLGLSEPYLLSEKLGMHYEVSKLPFAVLIDAEGVLRSKGLVNTREHLESLLESMDSGIVDVQEYLGGTLSQAAAADREVESTT